MPRKHLAALVAVAIITAFLPLAARATHCESPVYIFSRISNPGPTQVNLPYIAGIVCELDAGHEAGDTRMMYPVADQVSVRWTKGSTVSSSALVTARLDGLGFQEQTVSMKRNTFLDGSCCSYDTPYLSIPDGPGAIGCLNVTVTLPDEDNTELTGHQFTFGSRC